MADLAKIVEDLSALTVLEAAELSKLLEEKWGFSAAAPVAVAAVAGAGAAAAVEEEKTEFDVVLKDAGPEKIKVIKDISAAATGIAILLWVIVLFVEFSRIWRIIFSGS